MARRCEDICQDFEEHRPDRTIHEWKAMKRKWEVDSSQPDPYVLSEKGKTAIHATPSLLTLGFRSLKPRFCETKACGD
jgi:hypothetical protein